MHIAESNICICNRGILTKTVKQLEAARNRNAGQNTWKIQKPHNHTDSKSIELNRPYQSKLIIFLSKPSENGWLQRTKVKAIFHNRSQAWWLSSSTILAHLAQREEGKAARLCCCYLIQSTEDGVKADQTAWRGETGKHGAPRRIQKCLSNVRAI